MIKVLVDPFGVSFVVYHGLNLYSLQVPTSKRLEWQSNGTKRSLFSDKSPDSDVKINANIGESLHVSGILTEGSPLRLRDFLFEPIN